MASGVKVNSDCTTVFDEQKKKSLHRYVIYKLSDDKKQIIPDHCGDRSKTHEDFVAALKDAADKGECRFATFDLEFELKGNPKNKLLFVSWSPEVAVTKSKMVYTSSKDYLKKALNLTLEVQATDYDEISLDAMIEKAARNMKD